MQISLLQVAAVSLAAIVVPQNVKAPVTWLIEEVAFPAAVTDVVQAGDGVYARAGEWYLVFPCPDALLCIAPQEPVLPEAPEDGIPDGRVAVASSGDGIQRAWYAEPTERYAHGALGDVVEGGALIAEDVYGQRFTASLGPTEVFEDLTPRIVDIDGDGNNEIVTIRTSLRSGAQIAVYGISGSRLIERAATTPIGRANRWLNIAGIADFTGDGQLNIAIVKTPHIGGILEILAWSRNELKLVDSADGFSNHVFGSRDQGLSAVGKVNDDRIPDLVLPDAQRRSLRAVTAAGGRILEIAAIPLPAEAVTAIGVVSDAGKAIFATGLSDGSLVAVTRQ